MSQISADSYFDVTKSGNTERLRSLADTVPSEGLIWFKPSISVILATVVSMKIIRRVCLVLVLFGFFGCQDDETHVPPVVTSFSPAEGLVGSQVTIAGGNFGESPKVYINDVEMTVDDVADDRLIVTVPQTAVTGPIRVESNGTATTTTATFTIIIPRVDPIKEILAYSDFGQEVSVVSPGQTIYIGLDGIHTDGAKVFFNGEQVIDLRESGAGYLAEIPSDVHTGKFTLEAGGIVRTFEKVITVIEGKGAWNLDEHYPGEILRSPASFGIGDRFYYGIGEAISASYGGPGVLSQEFYEFDLKTSRWTELPAFPGRSSTQPDNTSGLGTFSFAINEAGYVSGGYSGRSGGRSYQFFRFDPTAKTWTELDTLDANVAIASYGFSIGNRGFALERQSGSLFEYDIDADTFNIRNNVPFILNHDEYFRHYALNGKAYFVVSSLSVRSAKLWEYNPTSDTWLALADVPYSNSIYAMTIDGQGFVGSESWFARYEGDGTFTQLPPPPFRLSGPSGNMVNNGYIFTIKEWSFPLQGYSRTYRFTTQ